MFPVSTPTRALMGNSTREACPVPTRRTAQELCLGQWAARRSIPQPIGAATDSVQVGSLRRLCRCPASQTPFRHLVNTFAPECELIATAAGRFPGFARGVHGRREGRHGMWEFASQHMVAPYPQPRG